MSLYLLEVSYKHKKIPFRSEMGFFCDPHGTEFEPFIRRFKDFKQFILEQFIF